jgi:hypothetical protein
MTYKILEPMFPKYTLLENAGDQLYIVHDNGQHGKRYKAGHDRDKALKLVERLNANPRANIEEFESGLHVCWRDHDKGETCNYVKEIDYSDLPYRVAQDTTEQVLADNAKKWADLTDLTACPMCGNRHGEHKPYCPNLVGYNGKMYPEKYTQPDLDKYVKAKDLENPFKLLAIIEDLQARVDALEESD